MDSPTLLDHEWQALLELLPPGWEDAAQTQGAFLRKRQIADPKTLLRLIFVYVWAGLSLRNTVAWAQHKRIATLSDVALLERLQRAQDWLAWMVAKVLATRNPLPNLTGLPYRVRLVDATVLCQPGSRGTDWRVHLQMDLHTQSISSLELTDAKGGESFTRYDVAADDLLVGDRGYAHRAGLVHVRAAGGHALVRFGWQNLPLQGPTAEPFDLMGALSELAAGQVGSWQVQTAPDQKKDLPAVSGRVIAVRKPQEAAQAARRQARKDAKKKGRTPDARTLFYCDFMLLFTTAPQESLPPLTALRLYRFRWQIECGFKRLKSGLHLDDLPAHDPHLCRTWIYAKLLGALLVETLSSSWASFSPWGVRSGEDGFPLAVVCNDLAVVAAGGGDRCFPIGVGGPRSSRTPQVLRPAA